MKRLSLALAATVFLALAAPAPAQTYIPVKWVTSPPGGTCSFSSTPQFNISDGSYWYCTGTSGASWNFGVWQKKTPPSGVVAGDGKGNFKAATVASFCGTTSTCAATAITSTLNIVAGAAPLVSGTPSTVTVSGFSPAFTSTTSYACTVTNQTTATNSALKVVNASASSITITGPNTLTDVIGFVCVGN